MPPRVSLSLGAIRGLVQAEVKKKSLRQVARDIEISYTGLRFFLKGSKPHPETLKRLVAWYGAARSGASQGINHQDVRVAISLVSRYIQMTPTRTLKRKRLESLIRTLMNELDAEDRGLLLAGLLDRQTS